MLIPKFHHVAPGQWINDPVGLYRDEDQWVLHDQRAEAVGDVPIGWGRATSSDLLHWRDEGMVIAPKQDEWIYSGCVVPEGKRIRAFFTLHNPSSGMQAQAEARWDGTWRRVPGERVPGRLNSRDPFVFRWRHEWRMLLALPPPWAAPTSRAARLGLLASTDLVEWRDLGLIGPQSEAGELFETPLLRRVPVADQPLGRWPWLLAVGVVDRRDGQASCGTRAWFGHFDGTEFEPTGEAFRLDSGPDFYAPALWSGTADEEVVMTGWTNSWSYARALPSRSWSGGAHALPRRLRAIPEGQERWSLRQAPVAMPQFNKARGLSVGSSPVGPRALITIAGEGSLRLGDLALHLRSDGIELVRTCTYPGLSDAGFAGRWFADRPQAPLHWLLDGCVAELFASDGWGWMSALTLRTLNDGIQVTDGLRVTLNSSR